MFPSLANSDKYIISKKITVIYQICRVHLIHCYNHGIAQFILFLCTQFNDFLTKKKKKNGDCSMFDSVIWQYPVMYQISFWKFQSFEMTQIYDTDKNDSIFFIHCIIKANIYRASHNIWVYIVKQLRKIDFLLGCKVYLKSRSLIKLIPFILKSRRNFIIFLFQLWKKKFNFPIITARK